MKMCDDRQKSDWHQKVNPNTDGVYMGLIIPLRIRFLKYHISVFVHENIMSWFQKPPLFCQGQKMEQYVPSFWQLRFSQVMGQKKNKEPLTSGATKMDNQDTHLVNVQP